MKMKKILFLGLMAIFGLVSCSEDDLATGYVDDGTGILVSVSDGFSRPQTRAAYDGFPATTFEEGDAIGIYAFNGSTYVNKNVKFTKQADGSWIPEEKVVYNPDYTYYAYFPYRETTYTPSTSGVVDDLDTKFSTFINDNNDYFWKADQSTKENFTASNLMIAKGIVNGKRSVKFTMEHKRGMAIISDAINQWYYTDDENNKYNLTPIFYRNVPYELNGTRYYLMKPNTTTSVAGLSLRAGSGKYMRSEGVQMTGTPSISYSTSTDGGNSWSDYSSKKPSWLTVTTSGNDDRPIEFIVTTTNSTSRSIYKGYVSRRSVSGDAILKAASPVSNIDLSMVDNTGAPRTTRTTANCYLVHAAGSYKIPLVYGNAIKNGETNESAYHSTEASSDILQRFVNHADAGIYDPWLKNNGVNVDGAELIWEDEKGMISSVGVNGDYITFSVNPDNIVEGNAVIAAKSGNTTVWSWHIWITPETLTDLTSVDTGSHVYQVAPVNIGSIHGSIFTEYIYAGELCRISAYANNLSLQFQVTAKDYHYYSGTYNNPSTYYQWGRFSPAFPATGAYDASGKYTMKHKEESDVYSIGTIIQNPGKLYVTERGTDATGTYSEGKGPYNEFKYNYWDMNNTSTSESRNVATVKTIYDPCPPEFCVPTSGCLNYIKRNLNSLSDNGKTYTNGETNIFFPYNGFLSATKYTESASFIIDYSKTGYYWSATPKSLYSSNSFYFASGSFMWAYYASKYGFSVRSVMEE